jgi:hypothetical protein
MDMVEEMQEIEDEEEISPIIRIFERLTFERGHEIHDQVSSMIELFSLSNVKKNFSLKKKSLQKISGNIRHVRHIS